MELIEREQQIKKPADSRSQARAGKGCIVLISGEAGTGKTSLIQSFIAEQERSTPGLWGACDDLLSPQPLGLFLDIAAQIQSDFLQLIRSVIQVIVGVGPDPANNERMIAWSKEYWRTLHPFSAVGGYVNMMMDEGQDRVKIRSRSGQGSLPRELYPSGASQGEV